MWSGILIVTLAAVFGGSWRFCDAICVLESDFGFTLNCAFKKSGLFRVRNLGGAKAHISFGLSLGDELGFKESLTNSEPNRRRSVEGSRIQAQLVQEQQKQTKQREKSLNINSRKFSEVPEPPEPPRKRKRVVMNAPKEYYPEGYEKNFDDNFLSRVELPNTTFSCEEQRHFPGLYADEDLACMIFHVCAYTDEGLIMKSFLCPESTLFDQQILKCNWQFYVNCKASKKFYDANAPVSKSYQLMKALTYFANMKKQATSTTRAPSTSTRTRHTSTTPKTIAMTSETVVTAEVNSTSSDQG